MKATILLVDDEQRVTDGLAIVLRKQPYALRIARSAEEALSVLAREHVDVVVSDEQMPGMTGSELLSIVSREFPHTARIILTGHPTLDAAVRAINDGKICRFLQKPCKPDELISVISEALRIAMLSEATDRLLRAAREENPHDGRRESSPNSLTMNRPETMARNRFGSFDNEGIRTLSIRECEVLEHILDGQRVSQVAKMLFISPHTVRNHLKGIFQKLGIHSQSELIRRSRGQGK